MVGLLYQEFIAMKGKIVAPILIAFPLLMLFVRILFQNVNADVFYVMFLLYAIMIAFFGIRFLAFGILQSDEKSMTRRFLYSMPTGVTKFVASRYLFFFIMEYIIFSYGIILCDMASIQAGSTMAEAAVFNELLPQLIMTFMPVFFAASILLDAVELPFFLIFGYRLGTAIKTTILVIVVFVIVCLLLFMDLTILDRYNISYLLDYMKEKPLTLSLITMAQPVVSVLVLFGSYKLTLAVMKRREIDHE